MPPTWTKYCKPIMQLLIQYLPLTLLWFNDFLHFNIPWMIVFLFSYSFLHYGQTSKKVLQHWVGGFYPRSCIYYRVKISNVFYLGFLWRKSLFQVVTKCANNYRFLKMCPLYRPLLIKHLLVNKIFVNIFLMRTLDTLDCNE